jgi:sulfopyruvate decarboxylase subunit beta
MLVTYRGTPDDPVFYHVPKGRVTEPVFPGASGSAPTATGRSARRSNRPRRMRKRPRAHLRFCCRGRISNGESRSPDQSRLLQALAESLPPQALVVTSLGNASSYLWAALHHASENFYLEDAMGLALPLAGTWPGDCPADASDDRGRRRWRAIDAYGHVGHGRRGQSRQPDGAADPERRACRFRGQALTNAELDLAQLARASGIARADNIAKPEALAAKIRAGTARDSAECLVLATEPDLDVVWPPTALEPVLTKYCFMTAIGAPRYIPTVFGGGKLEGA